MTKRPSFQFYPADWLRDTALRTCSEGARGVWMDMLCYMHEGYPYGHLKVNCKVILSPTLARMVGCAEPVLEGYLAELRSAGVVQVDSDGCYYSKRMVRDEIVREARAAGGSRGGNPNLMGGDDQAKVNLTPNLIDNLSSETKVNPNLTPSSSSSSSSSKPKRARFAPPSVSEVTEYCLERRNGIDPETFVDFYTANGWVQGKGKPVKDWKACIRTWERSRTEKQPYEFQGFEV